MNELFRIGSEQLRTKVSVPDSLKHLVLTTATEDNAADEFKMMLLMQKSLRRDTRVIRGEMNEWLATRHIRQ
jgi:hypothetical protein